MLVVAVAAALCFGIHRAAVDGRFAGTHRVRGAEVSGDPTLAELVETSGLDLTLGERATLLQFSTALCAPCRATRRTLSDIAAAVPGVEHVEVDAEHHLELVRRLGILRTPTTLVLDGRGAEVTRAAGAPRKDQVLAALDGVL